MLVLKRRKNEQLVIDGPCVITVVDGDTRLGVEAESHVKIMRSELLDHPRLKASRGEPLTETLGCRLSPELAEWMMGFPVGWTDVSGSKPAAMPSCPQSPSGSDAA